MIKRLTIRLRLIACMAFLGILLVVIGGVGINGIRTVNAALQDVYQKQMASALKLAEAKNFLNRSRFVIDRGVFHPEAPDLEKNAGPCGRLHQGCRQVVARIPGDADG